MRLRGLKTRVGGHLNFCLGNGPHAESSTPSVPDAVELAGDVGDAVPVLKKLSVQ